MRKLEVTTTTVDDEMMAIPTVLRFDEQTGELEIQNASFDQEQTLKIRNWFLSLEP